MISAKRHVQQLASMLREKGLRNIVCCPGSRNGPLLHTLVGCGCFDCRVIVDERSAGYFALGMVLATGKPVVLVCSSGTAAVNFAPAVAEAFYQKIPLIVLTADRPAYWIDQLENQCLHQEDLFAHFIRKSCSLPLEESATELWFAARMINDVLHAAISAPGPVHINIPLEEPLHQRLDEPLPEVKEIGWTAPLAMLADREVDVVTQQISSAEKILVLVGQGCANSALDRALSLFATHVGAVVVAEHLANLHLSSGYCCAALDLLLVSLSEHDVPLFQPDLLITCGGHFVCKHLRQFLRAHKPAQHIHVDAASAHMDTYQALTRVCGIAPEHFFTQLAQTESLKRTVDYVRVWQERENEVTACSASYVQAAPFCDLTVCCKILCSVPADSVVHFGNSTPVRYGLIAPAVPGVRYFGNRGTSGIDGSLSTAVGYASCSTRVNTLILGDLSFFYDSNGLWNRYLGANMKIVLLNNGGGNIFNMLEDLGERTGEDTARMVQDFFFAGHGAKGQGIAVAFGLQYLQASSISELEKALARLYHPASTAPILLEVFTPPEVSVQVFKGLFADIKKRIMRHGE